MSTLICLLDQVHTSFKDETYFKMGESKALKFIFIVLEQIINVILIYRIYYYLLELMGRI